MIKREKRSSTLCPALCFSCQMRTSVDEARCLYRARRLHEDLWPLATADRAVWQRNTSKIPFMWSVAAFPPRLNISRLERQNLACNQRLSDRSTTATSASKMRSSTTLDQTKLARNSCGGTDGSASRSGGRQFRHVHHRRKVPPLGSVPYASSRSRLAAFTV